MEIAVSTGQGAATKGPVVIELTDEDVVLLLRLLDSAGRLDGLLSRARAS